MKIHKNSLLIVGATVVAILISTFSSAFAWNFSVPAQEVQPVNGAFVFPVSAFADGKAKHFEYKISPDQRVRFFVVKSADGVLRTALDACEVCHRAKKGYVQQGNDMICVNCGLKFRTDKVGDIKGGCNPHPVNKTVQGDKLVINQQEIASGLRYFQ